MTHRFCSLQVPVFCGLYSLERVASRTSWFLGKTGKHLFLTDNDDGKPPLLLRMASDCENLKFMWVRITGDIYVFIVLGALFSSDDFQNLLCLMDLQLGTAVLQKACCLCQYAFWPYPLHVSHMVFGIPLKFWRHIELNPTFKCSGKDKRDDILALSNGIFVTWWLYYCCLLNSLWRPWLFA